MINLFLHFVDNEERKRRKEKRVHISLSCIIIFCEKLR